MLLGLAPNEIFILVFVLLIVFVVFALLICGFVIVISAIGRSARQEGAAWAATATQLGLQLAPFEESMRFEFDQVRKMFGARVTSGGPVTAQRMFGTSANRLVEVWMRQAHPRKSPLSNGPGRIQGKDVYTCCRAQFATTLGLDLTIKPRTFVSQLGRNIFGKEAVLTGIPGFDEHFHVDGNDPERVRELLSMRFSDGVVVGERFVAATVSRWAISASDGEVRVEIYGKVLDAERIAVGINVAQELAGRLEAGASHLGFPLKS